MAGDTRKKLERDALKLIESITQFKNGCENFSICREFALSNFLHHRFLTVTPSDVRRKLERFEERFVVNSLWSNVRRFQNLKKLFLSHVSTHCDKAETQYAVLYLLLKLAGQPGCNNNASWSKEESQHHKTDFIDIDFLEDSKASANKSDLNELREQDELSTSEDETEAKKGRPISPENPDSGVDVNVDNLVRLPLTDGKEADGNSFEASDWLNEKVVNPYWKNHRRRNHILTSRWNGTCNAGTVITERQLIFEFLWMVQGAQELVAFHWDGSKYRSRLGVHLSHVSEEALNCLLKPICHYGTIVKRLKDYVAETSRRPSVQTHQAYANTLNLLINHKLKRVTRLEEKIIKQDGTMSMHAVLEELEVVLRDLDALNTVHTQSVPVVPDDRAAWKKASSLTSCLYSNLMNLDTHLYSSEATMLLVLFVNTLRPFLDFVELLVTRAVTPDPTQEFVIVRNGDVQKDENFWTEAVATRDVPPSYFLRRILPDIILAGKSMAIVSNLGLLEGKSGTTGYLFDQFKNNLWEKLQPDGIPLKEEEWVLLYPSTENAYSDVGKFDEIVADKNFLLRENFTHLLCASCASDDNGDEKLDLMESKFTSAHPLQLQIEWSLFPLVRDLCGKADEELLSALECCHLSDHMEVLRKYFLMEAGEVITKHYSTSDPSHRCGDLSSHYIFQHTLSNIRLKGSWFFPDC